MKFTVKAHKQNIDFLDLHIFKHDGMLNTQTYFKNTDRNGYIPVRSCHHPRWKMAIPKGQFMRIKRNCTIHQDYMEQTDVLVQTFKDKGYSHDLLLKVREQVGNMDRNALLATKKKEEKDYNVNFITGFNKQFKYLEQSIKKYWPILQKNPILNKILPSKPKFIYRRAPGLRTKLVKNIPDTPP